MEDDKKTRVCAPSGCRITERCIIYLGIALYARDFLLNSSTELSLCITVCQIPRPGSLPPSPCPGACVIACRYAPLFFVRCPFLISKSVFQLVHSHSRLLTVQLSGCNVVRIRNSHRQKKGKKNKRRREKMKKRSSAALSRLP